MKRSSTLKLSLLFIFQFIILQAQQQINSTLLDIDRIYSGEFELEKERTIQWIEGGDAYVIIEKSQSVADADELIRYDSKTQAKSTFVQATSLKTSEGQLTCREFLPVKRRRKGADLYQFESGFGGPKRKVITGCMI